MDRAQRLKEPQATLRATSFFPPVTSNTKSMPASGVHLSSLLMAWHPKRLLSGPGLQGCTLWLTSPRPWNLCVLLCPFIQLLQSWVFIHRPHTKAPCN